MSEEWKTVKLPKTVLPIYVTKVNQATKRDATYKYNSAADEKTSSKIGNKELGKLVPSMPRFATNGRPTEWVRGQKWWRAGGWDYATAGAPIPLWKELKHSGNTSKDNHWSTKWNTTEKQPSWANYPKTRWNYFTEGSEWQNSPFEDYEPSPVRASSKSVDHEGFVRLWCDDRYKSVASLAKMLRWKRSKVIERRNIVNRWLKRVDGYDLQLPTMEMMSEHEEEQFLSQQAERPPTPSALANILGHLNIENKDRDVVWEG
jgi:hypothetical protein